MKKLTLTLLALSLSGGALAASTTVEMNMVTDQSVGQSIGVV